jgi:hypothetical protein
MQDHVVIERRITDMAKYGVQGAMRWSADIIIKNKHAINVHGQYFPTKRQAREWLKKQEV